MNIKKHGISFTTAALVFGDEDMIQQQFIEYSQRFARDNKVHIWLSGSFLKGGFTKYSDVDLAVKTDDVALVKKYI